MEVLSVGDAIKLYETLNILEKKSPQEAAELFMTYRKAYWRHPSGALRRVFHYRNLKMNLNMSALDALRKKR